MRFLTAATVMLMPFGLLLSVPKGAVWAQTSKTPPIAEWVDSNRAEPNSTTFIVDNSPTFLPKSWKNSIICWLKFGGLIFDVLLHTNRQRACINSTRVRNRTFYGRESESQLAAGVCVAMCSKPP